MPCGFHLWSERPDSNRQPPAWEAGALPIAPLSHAATVAAFGIVVKRLVVDCMAVAKSRFSPPPRPERTFGLPSEVSESGRECVSRPSADFGYQPELQFKADVATARWLVARGSWFVAYAYATNHEPPTAGKLRTRQRITSRFAPFDTACGPTQDAILYRRLLFDER